MLLNFGTVISQVICFFAAPLLLASSLALFVIRFDPRRHTLEQISTEAGAAAGADH